VTVAGIMPRDFFFPDRKTMYWEPASFTAADLNPDRHFLHVVARLKPGVTLERARRTWTRWRSVFSSSIRSTTPTSARW